MHTSDEKSRKAYETYLQRILILVITTAIFSLASGITSALLLLNQGDETERRSKITREIVVSVGACLIEPPPEKDGDALRKCVNNRLDNVDNVKKGDLDAPR